MISSDNNMKCSTKEAALRKELPELHNCQPKPTKHRKANNHHHVSNWRNSDSPHITSLLGKLKLLL